MKTAPRQILFIQGAGEGVHDGWDNKLVASLEGGLGEGYTVRYPRMPGEDDPRYADWKTALMQEFDRLEDGAILVGHSLGGTVLMHVLAQERLKPKVAGLFFVAAPFIGEGGWPGNDIPEHTRLGQDLPRNCPVYLYHGAGDTEVPVAHVHLYAKAIPQAVVRTLEDRDHQFNNDLSVVARDIRSMG